MSTYLNPIDININGRESNEIFFYNDTSIIPYEKSSVSDKYLKNLAINLLNQAYLTCPNSSENVNSLEMAISAFYNPEDISTRDKYINQIILIALHLSQTTYSGFYSILFNRIVRNMQSQAIIGFFESLPQWSFQDFFPELYNNTMLTPIEKAELQQRHMREFSALQSAFRKALDNETNVIFFRKCEDANTEDCQMVDLYSQCYNQICIQEKFQSTQSLQEANKPTYSSPTNTQIIVDGSPEGVVLWTYCLPTKDLLIAVITDQKNPLNNLELSSSTIKRVEHNFPLELKLVQYAVDRIGNNSI